MSKVSQEKVDELLKEMEENLPDFKIIYKEDSDWWKTNFSTLVAWLFVGFVGLFSKSFHKKFYEMYSNGLHGNTLVFPNRKDYGEFTDESVYRIMRHEYIHLHDQTKHPIWFAISYIALLPAVFTMRAHWELRGYTATMLVHYEIHGKVPDHTIDFIASQFTGGMYFWMYPFPKKIRTRLRTIRDRIYAGEINGLYF